MIRTRTPALLLSLCHVLAFALCLALELNAEAKRLESEIRLPVLTGPGLTSATLTAYHSRLCAKGDHKRGRTKNGDSACNESGIAADWAMLPNGTLLYIEDPSLPPRKRFRVVDDGCEACELAALSGELLLDVRHLTLAEAKKFGKKEDISVLIFPSL